MNPFLLTCILAFGDFFDTLRSHRIPVASLYRERHLPEQVPFDVELDYRPACSSRAGTLASQPRAMMCTPWQ